MTCRSEALRVALIVWVCDGYNLSIPSSATSTLKLTVSVFRLPSAVAARYMVLTQPSGGDEGSGSAIHG
jgi:hypothetical protein